MQKPTVSRIVHYWLTQQDADRINKRRQDAIEAGRSRIGDGAQVHVGNEVREGDQFPMIIVKVWDNGLVNGQVFLDGADTYWATSVAPCTLDDGYLGKWSWPTRI